jgi:hypothetical protein
MKLKGNGVGEIVAHPFFNLMEKLNRELEKNYLTFSGSLKTY